MLGQHHVLTGEGLGSVAFPHCLLKDARSTGVDRRVLGPQHI